MVKCCPAALLLKHNYGLVPATEARIYPRSHPSPSLPKILSLLDSETYKARASLVRRSLSFSLEATWNRNEAVLATLVPKPLFSRRLKGGPDFFYRVYNFLRRRCQEGLIQHITSYVGAFNLEDAEDLKRFSSDKDLACKRARAGSVSFFYIA